MRVFNETTRRMCAVTRTIRAIVDIYDDAFEFGYVSPDDPLLCPCIYHTENGYDKGVIRKTEKVSKLLIFSVFHGCYVIPFGFDKSFLDECQYNMGVGQFPYTFTRYYEAFNNFNLFEGKQQVVNNVNYKLSEYLKYTFGVEFETSMGYLPQDIAFRDGLIPLRDGSISGLEYSTVVMKGNNGINLLHQQVETLKKYTFFNKECSLHIHMGGYPVDTKAIFVLYTIACLLENDLGMYVPKYTFQTSKYKASGKDYCKYLNRYSSFEAIYEGIAEKEYNGSLYDPHPNDQERSHKWDCHSRYVWCNILNMICYEKGKTVEFRFLRPTYNFHKIYLWMYIFNGILLYAEKKYQEFKVKSDLEIIRILKKSTISLAAIMDAVYPEAIANNIKQGLTLLRYAVANQSRNGDFIGKDTFYEDGINEKALCDLL